MPISTSPGQIQTAVDIVEPRRAVDDEELGRSQAALDEIVEDGAPGLGALAAHALDREQHLLAVLAHAKDDKERDSSRFAVFEVEHPGEASSLKGQVRARLCQAKSS